MKKIFNNKGLSYIDVIVGISLLSIALAMLSPVTKYVRNHSLSNQIESRYIQVINNTLNDLNSIPDWENLENETKEILHKEMDIIYTFKGETEYKTNKLEVSFIINNVIKNYELERSVYYEENES